MNIIFEELKQKVAKIKDKATERSYYPLLCEFIVDYAKSGAIKLINPSATPEETSKQYENRVGFPDITVRNGVNLVGCIEVKKPEENLNSDKFHEQFNKYKDSLENIIFTNLREWQLWQWVKKEGNDQPEPTKIAQTIFDLTSLDDFNSADFEQFLARFLEGRSFSTRTPKQLALALAKKTQFLSKQVEEAIDENDKNADLTKLKETFEKTLIQNIKPHQFSNMVAETMAYSLFLAALEHTHRGNGSDLTLTNAIDYLPTNVPILADLYSLIKKVASTIPNISEAAQLLVDQLNASEIERIRQKLVDHKPGEDPVIQFYEPFLKEYDPEEKKDRGVFYTPKPVVDYIIRSVDWILKNKFNKEKGLADHSVHILDPATGTGTFLMSAIQEIHKSVKEENNSLGEEMVTREFNKIVLEHILKHFYGFELLVAPYAIAHLKLTLEVERLGFDFSQTKNDNEPDNDRFKIYLANTLDDPRGDKDSKGGVGEYESWLFRSIPEESKAARKVKNEVPILVITGNPPYSNFGQMNQGEWILNLLKEYKKGLNEKKINLDDDFIKFIRFAQWKLEQTGQGIFAMITSNTFIDGITHRQMRRSLLDTFDEIYIYNLHGNNRKHEISPDGTEDENVFLIKTGVSINILIKYPTKKSDTTVKFADLWGLRNHKFDVLLRQKFEETDWQIIDVEGFNKKFSETKWGINFDGDLNFFVQKEANMMVEYGNYWGITEIFSSFNSGIITRNDSATIHFEKETTQNIIDDYINLSTNELRKKYNIKDGKSWTLEDAKKDVIENRSVNEITPILYRPFDIRFTLFTKKSGGFLNRPIYDVMRNMIHPNLALLSKRQSVKEFSYLLVSNLICESCVFESAYANNSVFPLYIYKDATAKLSLLDVEEHDKTREPNLSPKFIKEFSERLELKFISDGQGDLETTFGPEDVLYFSYAVFHSPSYRSRYAEQLKIDFPRLPITFEKKIFQDLVKKGNELVNLHLLGENPFDKSNTILDKPEKWGGIKPVTEKRPVIDWLVSNYHYDEKSKCVYVNRSQYFTGVEKETWDFVVGGYPVLETWLKYRKNAERSLSTEDLKHFMKIVVALRETIRIMQEIDKAIPEWPMK